MQTIEIAKKLVNLTYEKMIRDDQWGIIKLMLPHRKPQDGWSAIN